ncbi:MAG: phosphatidate cytidylyltransferase [Terriglobales bacterium]
MTRVWTAVALVIPTLAIVVWAPAWLFTVLLAAVAVLGVHEFFGFARSRGFAPFQWIGFIATVVFVVLVSFAGSAGVWAAVLVALVLALGIRALCQPSGMERHVVNASTALFGALYLGVLLGLLGGIRNEAAGVIWLVFLLVVVWVGDTAALYAGRAWGRHRMAPRVSPKKSWEGAAASFLVALLLGAGFGAWTNVAVSNWPILAMALLGGAINVAAQVGDLVESLFKRGAQVKDSGTLLPGHGGVLDRVDALLFAAPVLWFYVTYLH